MSNDYYLVDDHPTLRRYRISHQAVVWGSLGLGRTVEPQQVPLEHLLTFLRTDPDRSSTLFHLEVEDGVVVGVEEQYRP